MVMVQQPRPEAAPSPFLRQRLCVECAQWREPKAAVTKHLDGHIDYVCNRCHPKYGYDKHVIFN